MQIILKRWPDVKGEPLRAVVKWGDLVAAGTAKFRKPGAGSKLRLGLDAADAEKGEAGSLNRQSVGPPGVQDDAAGIEQSPIRRR